MVIDTSQVVSPSVSSSPEHANALQLNNVRHVFKDTLAVDNVSFAIDRGEFLSLLGPSGCGKTTTLSMIAGFLSVTDGTIRIGGRRVEHLAPEQRNTGMVFQNYALFPHMSVFDNVGFGLRMRGTSAEQTTEKVQKALQMVSMEDYGDRSPSQLSGGQQQRIALARAMVIQPDLLLLDEPFGALDRQLREGMQLELKALQKSTNLTTLFVTHDQDEALSMSDRIAIMNQGNIEQVDSPLAIYEYPQTTFVARFIGKSNLFDAQIVSADASHTVIDGPMGRLILPALASGLVSGTTIECMVRPENIRCSARGESDEKGVCKVSGPLRGVVYHGSTREVHIDIGGYLLLAAIARSTDSCLLPDSTAVDDTVWAEWNPEDTRVFVDGRLCPWKLAS